MSGEISTRPRLNDCREGVSLETPIPAPGSTAFDVFLSWLPELGLEMGGIGKWGPRLPRIRPATVDAPSADLIEASRARWARSRIPHEQVWPCDPSHVTERNAPEVVMRTAWLEESLRAKTWQPSRLPAVCMSAAAAKRLGGLVTIENGVPVSTYPVPDTTIGAHFGMGVKVKTNGGRECQQVSPLRSRGDAYWLALGRWPWAVFDTTIPRDWWCHRAALDSLQAAHDRAGGGTDLAQRVAAAREVAQALADNAELEARALRKARWHKDWNDLDVWTCHRLVRDAKRSL